EVRVRRQVPGGSEGSKQAAENLEVPVGWEHDDRAGLRQPSVDEGECVLELERRRKYGASCAQSQEREEHRPLESGRPSPGQHAFEPGLRLPMERSIRVDGVEEKVRIDELHFLR